METLQGYTLDERRQEKNTVGIREHLTWQQFMSVGVDGI